MILHTEIKGKGEPIIFLHTGLQTGATDFVEHQQYFQNQYQVLAPDLRGHGQSKNREITNFFEDSAKDLKETLEVLGIDSAHIVGASLGALVAVHLGVMFPEVSKSLTLSGITIEKPENWVELHQKDVKQQDAILENTKTRAYFESLHGPHWKDFIYKAKEESWYPFCKLQEIKNLKIPIHLIFGKNSKQEITIVENEELNKENIYIDVLSKAGHLVHQEQTEAFIQIMELFLDENT